ncbi:hypothetical protein MKX01_022172 [Papaver californicum]|nr:hypothetical protein MKX01_022172 [Papaver californicum]
MENEKNPLMGFDTFVFEDFVHDDKVISSSLGLSENSNVNIVPEGLIERIIYADSHSNEQVEEVTVEREDLGSTAAAANVVVLECESSAEGGSCKIHLVGTAHVSQESCEEVQAIVSHLKPQVVFLELCANRISILTPQNLELEVFPGSEFRVAFEEAMKCGGKVILGDRPVNITLRRTWAKMTTWHKIKFVYCILKEMEDADMLTLVIQEMSKKFPSLMETLLFERDLYMAASLLSVASEHTSVVAVVGKGHLRGIAKHWQQPIEVRHLLEIPTQRSRFTAARILTYSVAVAGAAIISGIYFVSKK